MFAIVGSTFFFHLAEPYETLLSRICYKKEYSCLDKMRQNCSGTSHTVLTQHPSKNILHLCHTSASYKCAKVICQHFKMLHSTKLKLKVKMNQKKLSCPFCMQDLMETRRSGYSLFLSLGQQTAQKHLGLGLLHEGPSRRIKRSVTSGKHFCMFCFQQLRT